ncbi:hypothetical protein VOLCADRAFT_95162 [Volvox carteri f. nagariensis]|uniref:EF-hand domain-containing protein n=1 Tax=Volvox carteri f. nagariensis TaxID=3068 RepID=D8U6S1_VOLCA|nr:uncharacterized protein VOLCADRAFT_95162 [Volvox carteri f. nagariensis]EFJ44559.1 hypothetical protein VOLCADRAFT_95162 [Volvox carteri f. nagariensis]|eukprot:XP_002954409.1 hypothetical protein VOLCADRAFT_95162 [Volvox carteri f. nagariensis]
MYVQVIEAQPHVPFELSVLEVLLHVTLSYFERRRAHITWMVDRIVGDAVAGSGSAGGGSLGDGFGGGGGGGEGTLGNGDPFGGIGESTVQQLVPLEKLPPHDLAVPGVAAAAAAGTGAVEVTASPPPPLAEVAAAAAAAAPRRGGFGVLTPTIGVDPLKRREMLRNQAMEDASRILETYLREVQSVVGSLLEKEDFLDSTRETYRMQLDSARNHIILVNLWISVASISLMVATLPSAFFGMNVEHGLEVVVEVVVVVVEEVWVAFPLIVALSVGLAVGSFPALLRFFTNRFLRQTRQGTRNLLMLRAFLMQHSDDLEAITEALRSLPVAAGLEGSPISRTAFRTHMRNRLPRHVTLSDSHLDYLFNQFDRDNDGVLSEAEATLRSKLSYSGSSGSGGGGSRRGGSGSGRGSSSRHRPLTLDGGPGSLGGVVGSDGEPFLDELDGQVDRHHFAVPPPPWAPRLGANQKETRLQEQRGGGGGGQEGRVVAYRPLSTHVTSRDNKKYASTSRAKGRAAV